MEKRAFWAMVTGSIIAGLTGLFIKNISAAPTTIAFVRTAFPSFIIGIWMLASGISFFRGNYKKMILASSLNAVRMYLFLMAYKYTSITLAVMMIFTWPIFVNILSSIWLKERISLKHFAILSLAFIGIIIIYGKQEFSLDNNDFIGMSAGVLSALFYSFSFIIYKSEIKNYHRNEVIFYQNFIGAFVFLPFFLFVNEAPTGFDYPLMIIYSTLMGVVIFNFFFFGLKYLQASQASMIAYVEILSAITTGVLFMGDKITTNILIGGCFILTSIFLLRTLKHG